MNQTDFKEFVLHSVRSFLETKTSKAITKLKRQLEGHKNDLERLQAKNMEHFFMLELLVEKIVGLFDELVNKLASKTPFGKLAEILIEYYNDSQTFKELLKFFNTKQKIIMQLIILVNAYLFVSFDSGSRQKKDPRRKVERQLSVVFAQMRDFYAPTSQIYKANLREFGDPREMDTFIADVILANLKAKFVTDEFLEGLSHFFSELNFARSMKFFAHKNRTSGLEKTKANFSEERPLLGKRSDIKPCMDSLQIEREKSKKVSEGILKENPREAKLSEAQAKKNSAAKNVRPLVQPPTSAEIKNIMASEKRDLKVTPKQIPPQAQIEGKKPQKPERRLPKDWPINVPQPNGQEHSRKQPKSQKNPLKDLALAVKPPEKPPVLPAQEAFIRRFITANKTPNIQVQQQAQQNAPFKEQASRPRGSHRKILQEVPARPLAVPRAAHLQAAERKKLRAPIFPPQNLMLVQFQAYKDAGRHSFLKTLDYIRKINLKPKVLKHAFFVKKAKIKETLADPSLLSEEELLKDHFNRREVMLARNISGKRLAGRVQREKYRCFSLKSSPERKVAITKSFYQRAHKALAIEYRKSKLARISNTESNKFAEALAGKNRLEKIVSKLPASNNPTNTSTRPAEEPTQPPYLSFEEKNCQQDFLCKSNEFFSKIEEISGGQNPGQSFTISDHVSSEQFSSFNRKNEENQIVKNGNSKCSKADYRPRRRLVLEEEKEEDQNSGLKNCQDGPRSSKSRQLSDSNKELRSRSQGEHFHPLERPQPERCKENSSRNTQKEAFRECIMQMYKEAPKLELQRMDVLLQLHGRPLSCYF